MGSGYRTFTAGEVLTASNVQNYLQDQAVMVFGGSAARSSAIGTANFEEGMTSYLTDTDKLEVYNGTNWVGVAPATTQGLTLINTTSFSGVSSQNILNVFSATYNRYRIHLYARGSTGSENSLRFLDGSTPHTTGNYRKQQIYAQSTTVAANRSTTATSWPLGVVLTAEEQYLECNLLNPFQSVRPSGWMNDLQGIAGDITWSSYAVSCDATTAFTGFQVFPASGTITGKVSTYGWNE